jgi:hypothetical protein
MNDVTSDAEQPEFPLRRQRHDAMIYTLDQDQHSSEHASSTGSPPRYLVRTTWSYSLRSRHRSEVASIVGPDHTIVPTNHTLQEWYSAAGYTDPSAMSDKDKEELDFQFQEEHIDALLRAVARCMSFLPCLRTRLQTTFRYNLLQADLLDDRGRVYETGLHSFSVPHSVPISANQETLVGVARRHGRTIELARSILFSHGFTRPGMNGVLKEYIARSFVYGSDEVDHVQEDEEESQDTLDETERLPTSTIRPGSEPFSEPDFEWPEIKED